MTGCYQGLSMGGVQVVIAEPMQYEHKTKRTWFERLFTRPFQPFKTHNSETRIVETVEDDQFLRFENKIVVNAKTWHKLRLELEAKEKSFYVGLIMVDQEKIELPVKLIKAIDDVLCDVNKHGVPSSKTLANDCMFFSIELNRQLEKLTQK